MNEISADEYTALAANTGVEVLLFTIPDCPPAGLSPNAREHWRTRAQLARNAKEQAGWSARVALDGRDAPLFTGPVVVYIRILWAKGRKTVDADNALAMCKAYIDGCNGVLWTDDKQCTFAPVEQIRDPLGVGRIAIGVVAK